MLPYSCIVITVLIEMKGFEGMLIKGNNAENALYLLNFF